MKKRILLTMGAAFAVTAAMAQAPLKSPVAPKQILELPARPKANANADKQVTDHYYFSYEDAEADLGREIVGWFAGNLQDRRDTTSSYGRSRGYYSMVSKFGDLVVFNSNTDEILYGDYNNVQELRLDSVLFVAGFLKSTPVNIKDSLIVSVYGVDANNFPVISGTPIATDTLELTESIPATNTGSSGAYLKVEFGGIVIPNHKFAIRFEFRGDTLDSLYLGYQFPSDGQSCVVDGTPAPYNAPTGGEYYPQTYYTAPLDPDTLPDLSVVPVSSVLLPRDPASERPYQYLWYSTCNGTSSSIDGATYTNNPATNGTQYLMTVPFVTIKHNINVQDMDAKSLTVNNYPNPAADFTTVEFSTVNEGNATLKVTDLTGKQIANHNLGKVVNGVNKFDLNTSNYSAGVYVYTLNVDGIQVTKKFVVAK